MSKKWIIVLATLFVPIIAIQAKNIGPPAGACQYLEGTDIDNTNDVNYVSAGGRELSFMFEQDTSGNGTTAVVSIKSCTNINANACEDLPILDSNGDGLGDSNVFDGTSGQRGTLVPVSVAGFVQVSVDTAPTSGQTPIFAACATKMNR